MAATPDPDRVAEPGPAPVGRVRRRSPGASTGTRYYLAGYGEIAVSVALVEAGDPVIGVIHSAVRRNRTEEGLRCGT